MKYVNVNVQLKKLQDSYEQILQNIKELANK